VTPWLVQARGGVGKSWKGVDGAAIYKGKSPGRVAATSRTFSTAESRISPGVCFGSNQI
jgi:hypothetical protein